MPGIEPWLKLLWILGPTAVLGAGLLWLLKHGRVRLAGTPGKRVTGFTIDPHLLWRAGVGTLLVFLVAALFGSLTWAIWGVWFPAFILLVLLGVGAAIAFAYTWLPPAAQTIVKAAGVSIGKWFMANWAWFVVGLLPLVALPMLFGDAGWEALGSPWFQVFFAVVMIISIRAGWMFLPVIFTSIFLFMVFVNSTPQKTTEWARWLFSSTKDTVVEGASNDYATGKKVLGALQVGAGVDKTPTDWKNLPVQVNPQVTVTHDIRPSYSPDFNRAREWINTPYAPYKGVEVIGGEKPTPPPKPMAEAKPKPTTTAKPSRTEYKTIKPERYRYTDGVKPLESTDCVISMGGVDLEAGHPAISRIPAYKEWTSVARYKEIHHWGDGVSVYVFKSLPKPGEQPHPNPTLHVARGGCPSSPS